MELGLSIYADVLKPWLFVLVLAGFGLWLARRRGWLRAASAAALSAGLGIVLVGFTPSAWIRPQPDVGGGTVDSAAILGFGYERGPAGEVKPGPANEFLFIRGRALASKLLVQEGIWVVPRPPGMAGPGVTMERIHRHDEDVYIDTLETALCAITRLRAEGARRVYVVAHDLQLQRAYWDFVRVRNATYPELQVVIPQPQETPFCPKCEHWQTWNAFLWKLAELLAARPRDLFRPVPTVCRLPA